jgi:hypothetical protein
MRIVYKCAMCSGVMYLRGAIVEEAEVKTDGEGTD